MTENPQERLMLQVKKMLGYEPTGMSDLFNILCHPDCIRFTMDAIEWKQDST